MTTSKSERLLNLAIALLSARRFLGREQIRDAVEGYHDLSDLAFQRQFERDKDELRALGVPVATGHNDILFDDEPGYRIARADFELPPIELTADERVALGLAAEVFRGAALAPATSSALNKLRAAGVEPETERLTTVLPSVATREPSFPVFWQAVVDRTVVEFGYRDHLRRVEPWRLISRRGSWYIQGRDLGTAEIRTFKLARVVGAPRPVGDPGAYEVPSGAELAAYAASLEPAAGNEVALVAVRGAAAPTLRRRGRLTDREAPASYAAYEVPYARLDELAGEVRAAGADALVLEPRALRDAVIDGLRHLAGDVR